MSPRERAEIAMRGGRPDRVPVVPLIDTSYAAACLGVPVSQCFLSPEVHAQALLSALEQHPGIDGLSINIGLTADVIVDLVSSGNTLRANNLVAVEEIARISARLIVNQAALKLKRNELQPVIDAFAGAVASHA